MHSADRRRLRERSRDLSAWLRLAEEASARRQAIQADAELAAAALRDVAVEVPLEGKPAWLVLPLGAETEGELAALGHPRESPELDESVLARLLGEGPRLVAQISPVTGWRRFFVGSETRERGRAAGTRLDRLHELVGKRLVDSLEELLTAPRPAPVAVGDALQSPVRLGDWVAPSAQSAALVDVRELRGLGDAVATLLIALHTEVEFRNAAHDAADEIRIEEAREVLAGMSVGRLREATRGRLPVGAFREAGIETVLDVFERMDTLDEVPGVGEATATRLAAAAQTIWRTTYEQTRVHIDVVARTAAATALLARLLLWCQARTIADPAAEYERVSAVHAVLTGITRHTTHLAVFCLGGAGVDELRARFAEVAAKARTARVPAIPEMPADPWADFLARPAHYYALLSELGFLAEPGARIHGDVPEAVVDAIRTTELRTDHLTASLRGYQDFAAKFALVQGRVLIGDEMGLGKTVEALAALAHLRAEGERHFLVICPAAVVTNWLRETADKTTLVPHRLHGPGRDDALRAWLDDGGVAVTSFASLGWLLGQEPSLHRVACVVVDEAHYVKNPDAKRTARTAEVLEQVPRAISMTGTPLLNRVEEFRSLVGQLRPDLVERIDPLATAHDFRRAVAPVYLRRNQEDVLTELPPLVEVPEWVPLTAADRAAYLAAVEAGNFMAMRRAAATAGPASGKLRRLAEIVDEAEDNGRRVIVFSYFRDVLDQVADVLPGPVFGPLTGSVPPADRQRVVDNFSAGSQGAALVAQIDAIGVGMNIQAASVVVICEPQLNPAREWQAIARAHRMGQLHSVQVHRLLSEEGVDVTLTDLLAAKRQTFDDYARTSNLAQHAPEAFDVTEAELARQVVAAERERLFGIHPDGAELGVG